MSTTFRVHPMTTASRVLQILLACTGGIALVVDAIAYSWLHGGTFVLHMSDPHAPGRQVSYWTGSDVHSPLWAFLWLPVVLSMAVVVLWLIWQHGSTANLWARGYRDLKIRPGWAVGWWFIPVANYAMPLVAMLELDRRSTADGTPRRASPILGCWWAVWLLSSTVPVFGMMGAFLSAIGDWTRGPQDPIVFDFTAAAHAIAPWLLLAGVLQALAAGLAIMVVRRIDKGQVVLATAPDTAPSRPDAGAPW
jgi:Domain of unknown function (DUF4328)